MTKRASRRLQRYLSVAGFGLLAMVLLSVLLFSSPGGLMDNQNSKVKQAQSAEKRRLRRHSGPIRTVRILVVSYKVTTYKKHL